VVSKIISNVMKCCLFTKHFLDSISLRIFNMADLCLVMCLYKWPWTLHSYKWSFYGP